MAQEREGRLEDRLGSALVLAGELGHTHLGGKLVLHRLKLSYLAVVECADQILDPLVLCPAERLEDGMLELMLAT